MGVFDVKQFGGSIVIEISNEITFTIVEILLGGNGSGKILEREFTEIEISLMKNIFRQMEKSTEDAWASFAELDATLMRVETNSRLMHTFSMDERVLIIVMEIEINSIKGTINVCIPVINLEPLVEKGSRWNAAKRNADVIKDSQSKEAVIAGLKDAYIDISG